jgi:hypothetical protein
MWWQGPWMKHMVPHYWPIQGATLGTLVVSWICRRRRRIPVCAIVQVDTGNGANAA